MKNEENIMVKYQLTFGLLLIAIMLGCRSFGEYTNHKDLESEGRNFEDVYQNCADLSEIKTDGYYFHLDSIQMYKIIIGNGDTCFRYKYVIDEYKRNNNWMKGKQLLGEYTGYRVEYFWLNNDGLGYVAHFNITFGDETGPNFYITNSPDISKDSVQNIIHSQIEKYWESKFVQIKISKVSKAAIENVKDEYHLYYFKGQLELPDYLDKFSFEPINDSTLILTIPNYNSNPDSAGVKNKKVLFHFHKSNAVPPYSYITF